MNVLGTVASIAKKQFEKGGEKLLETEPARPLIKGKYDKIDKPVSDFFTLGFAKTEIMPGDFDKKKYYVAGYRAYNPAKAILDPMTASAVWLDDNSGRGGVVFVSTDTIGLLSHDVELIRASLKNFCRETGCRSVNIMSTHNHASIDTMGYWGALPLTGRNPKYMQSVRDKIKRVVEKAYADRRSGDLFLGSCEAPPVQRDSRLPEVYSKTLTRLRFVPYDGSRQVYMLNFASHSESLLGRNSLVSADFPCYIRREIFDKTGAETIYFVGAIGGLIRLKELDPDNIRSTMIAGRQLAEAALGIDNEKKLSPVINMLRQPFYIQAENLMLLLATKIGIMKAKKYAHPAAPLKYVLKTEMTYFNIGSLQMLLLPCELFPELAYGGYLSAEESAQGKGPEINPAPLIEIAKDENLLVFGLANDEIGYVVPPNDYLLDEEAPYLKDAKDRLGRNHYEETNGLGPATAARIAEVFTNMMETVRNS